MKVIRKRQIFENDQPVQLSFSFILEIPEMTKEDFLKDTWDALLEYSRRQTKPIEREIREVQCEPNTPNQP